MDNVELTALEFSRVFNQRKPTEALWQTIELAPVLESAGYSRYWLGEHHTHEVAHSCPEILLPVIAGTTTRIRVGTAGILLRYYSPLKVAKVFRVLHALFPGRVDLGVARGLVSEQIGSLLGIGNDDSSYETRVTSLAQFLRGKGPALANPGGVPCPEIWVLGQSVGSALLAARIGAGFCFGLFLAGNPDQDLRSVFAAYRSTFQPSNELSEPKWSVAVSGSCAESDVKAELQAKAGNDIVFSTVIGGPAKCRAKLIEIGDICETRQFVFLDVSPHFEDRARSYQLLASAMELSNLRAS